MDENVTGRAHRVPTPVPTPDEKNPRFAGRFDSCLAHLGHEQRMGEKERRAFIALLGISAGLIGFLAWLSRRDTP